ncbi:MAG: hypothetical protein ACE5WD_03765 [Candidatus Aminicenantia bacterium]
MKFLFVPDHHKNFRFLSEEPPEIEAGFSRWRKFWLKAKRVLAKPFPQKVLLQEQAFTRILSLEQEKIQIFYPKGISPRRIKIRFKFFLHRERTKHIGWLIGEGLLLPISGLAALLPGPNVFFYVLAILTITHWQALRGINKLIKKNYELISCPTLGKWYQSIKEGSFSQEILQEIGKKYKLENIIRVLSKELD